MGGLIKEVLEHLLGELWHLCGHTVTEGPHSLKYFAITLADLRENLEHLGHDPRRNASVESLERNLIGFSLFHC